MIEYYKENEKRLASITAFTVRPLHNRHNPFTLLHKIMNNSMLRGKDGQYRDTGSVEPGSRQNFGSVSGSENQLLGIFYTKDTFSLY